MRSRIRTSFALIAAAGIVLGGVASSGLGVRAAQAHSVAHIVRPQADGSYPGCPACAETRQDDSV